MADRPSPAKKVSRQMAVRMRACLNTWTDCTLRGMREIVAVVGASSDRRKFGNKAVRAFARQGFDVKPVNPSETTIEGLPVFRSVAEVPGPIDRVTLYVPPEIGLTLLDAIAAKHPRE